MRTCLARALRFFSATARSANAPVTTKPAALETVYSEMGDMSSGIEGENLGVYSGRNLSCCVKKIDKNSRCTQGTCTFGILTYRAPPPPPSFF